MQGNEVSASAAAQKQKRMKKSILIGFILAAASTTLHAIGYPRWFLYPGRWPEMVIGFSYNGNPPVTDAEVMYCVYRHCEVEGYLETYSDNTINYLKNARYHYLYPENDLKWVEGKLQRQDRFVLSVASQDYVDAFSLSANPGIEKTKTEPGDIPVPSWLDRTAWDEGDYYYGTGMVSSVGNPSECWKNSEEQAIYAILTSICIKFYSLKRLELDSRFRTSELKEYSRTDLKFHISSIQTMERYPDTKKQLYYTLVRIHKSNVIPLLFNTE